MKNREYKDAWNKLKDELISDFYKETERLNQFTNISNSPYAEYWREKVIGQRNQTLSHLTKMEDLDGTCEFKNLLDDMNRECE